MGDVYTLLCLLSAELSKNPSTIFQLNRDGSSWVEPVLSQDKCVLLEAWYLYYLYSLKLKARNVTLSWNTHLNQVCPTQSC